jgi:GH35 family endo-1,4-beta-xylanase
MLARLAFLVALAVSGSAAAVEERAKSKPPTTLKDAAAPRYFGAALAYGHLTNSSDPEFATLARDQFSGVTPENEMKWCVCSRLPTG